MTENTQNQNFSTNSIDNDYNFGNNQSSLKKSGKVFDPFDPFDNKEPVVKEDNLMDLIFDNPDQSNTQNSYNLNTNSCGFRNAIHSETMLNTHTSKPVNHFSTTDFTSTKPIQNIHQNMYDSQSSQVDDIFSNPKQGLLSTWIVLILI